MHVKSECMLIMLQINFKYTILILACVSGFPQKLRAKFIKRFSKANTMHIMGQQLTRRSLHNIKVEKFFIYLSRTILLPMSRVLAQLAWWKSDEISKLNLHVRCWFERNLNWFHVNIERNERLIIERLWKQFFLLSHGFSKGHLRTCDTL